jgi:hypothetical protein
MAWPVSGTPRRSKAIRILTLCLLRQITAQPSHAKGSVSRPGGLELTNENTALGESYSLVLERT